MILKGGIVQINFEEKLLIFTDEELSIQENSESAGNDKLISQLFSVMAYPNKAKKQNLYILGLLATNLEERFSDVDGKKILKSNKKLLYELYKNKTEALKVYNDTMRSRQKGDIGAPLTRGGIAGDILTYLVLCGGGLEQAYTNFLDYCPHWEIPVSPSISALKKIWKDFRGISPLWSAYKRCRETPHIVKMAVNDPDSEEEVHPAKILQIASFFRNELIGMKNPSTKSHLIKDTSEVWNFLNSKKHPIPPAKLFSHKIK